MNTLDGNQAENIFKIIEVLRGEYYNFYPSIEPVPYEVILTDDLNRTHKSLRPDIHISDLDATRNNDNGRMIVPKDIDGQFYILLNIDRIETYTRDGSLTWVSTFAHELTHAHDYYQMARLDNLTDYTLLEKQEYFLFCMWSEFHARRNGYSFLRHFFEMVSPENVKSNQEDYVVTYEWPTHRENYFKDYHSTTNGSYQINLTMQLLGRYSVWCDCFPSRFCHDAIVKDFPLTPWMWHLFDFLMEHKTIERVRDAFDKMKAILSENWPIE